MTKPTKEQVKEIFDWWNSKGIVLHRSIDRHEKHINASLKLYSMIEIKEAIDNYSDILGSYDHYWTYRWSLKDFLIRGLDRFITENDPFRNFRSGTASNTVKDIGDFIENPIDPPDPEKNFVKKFLKAKKERTK